MSKATSKEVVRRPIAVRSRAWSLALSRAALKLGLTPNAVSLLSVVFALLAMCSLIWSGRAEPESRTMWLLLAAGSIQLRLLCNMLDGLDALGIGIITSPEVLQLPDDVKAFLQQMETTTAGQ